jgi:hypothetical protein
LTSFATSCLSSGVKRRANGRLFLGEPCFFSYLFLFRRSSRLMGIDRTSSVDFITTIKTQNEDLARENAELRARLNLPAHGPLPHAGGGGHPRGSNPSSALPPAYMQQGPSQLPSYGYGQHPPPPPPPRAPPPPAASAPGGPPGQQSSWYPPAPPSQQQQQHEAKQAESEDDVDS